MVAYVVISKFMGLWPTEKALQAWIKNHWKPKGEITLHLGSKGFFTVVFANMEDKDKVFEGGPYFYVVVGLYMWPWIMNFFLESETFTSVLVGIRLYSLPLYYWLPESSNAISNKLGNFLKISDATLHRKYTSLASICVEINLSRAILDEHRNLFRDCPLKKMESNITSTSGKDIEGFTKVGGRAKGRSKNQKKSNDEG